MDTIVDTIEPVLGIIIIIPITIITDRIITHLHTIRTISTTADPILHGTLTTVLEGIGTLHGRILAEEIPMVMGTVDGMRRIRLCCWISS